MLHKLKDFILNPDWPLFKEVMVLALPVIVSNISRVLMHITDTAMVGHLGKDPLVAVAMSGMMIWIAISVGIGFRIATQSVTSRRLGQGKLADCGVALRNTQLMCFFLTVPLSFLGYFFSDFIVRLFLNDPNVIPLSIDYLSVVSFSIYFSVAAFIFQGFYTGIEKTTILMYVTIISNLLNIYLNAGLIYGYENIYLFFDSYGISWLSFLWAWYDFQELGVKGAAIATLLSSIIMMVAYLLYLFKEEIRTKYKVFAMNIDIKMMKKQFSIGYPQTFSEISINFAFLLFYTIMGIIGTAQLAATQIVFAIAHASFLPAVGVGQACATLVGKYMGQENINKASQSMIEGLRGAYIIMGTMGIIFIFFPHYIVPLFTKDMAVVNMGIKILPWIGVFQFFDAIAITLWFALSGAGDTKFTAYMGIIVNWLVFVPLCYFLGIVLNLGLVGPWIAVGVFLFLEAILVIFRVNQGKWKHIKV